MPMFTKKPVTIEARQWDGTAESAEAIVQWIEQNSNPFAPVLDHSNNPQHAAYYDDPKATRISIATLEGPFSAPAGWWIIRGVKGEFYACEPDIFDLSYDAA